MFDPTKLVAPLDLIVTAANERVSKLLIDKNNTVIKEAVPATGYFNTKAIVDTVNSDAVVTRVDREILYDRVDVGQFVDAIAIETKDIYSVTNKNIVTDYVTQTSVNPTLTELVTLFNDEYKLPVEDTDLLQVPRTQVTGRDTSFGRVYKDINCKITTGSILHSGGNIVVHQRADTHPFSYNKIVTSKPGFMVYREWEHSDVLEITLPEIDSITQGGWEMMFEDVKSTQQLGNGSLWFKIKHDSNLAKWVYESISGKVITIDVTSLAKIKISVVEGVLTVDCSTFVNNNAYESVGSDPVIKLSTTRGLQRVTLHTINPIPTLFNLKVKLTQNEFSSDEGLIANDKTYDYTYNQLQASPTSNATLGLVDKNIVITSYNVANYAESTTLNTFVAAEPSKRGLIQSFNKFDIKDGHKVTFDIESMAASFKNDSLVSISVEQVNREDTTKSMRVLFKNPVATEGGVTLSAERYINGRLIDIHPVSFNGDATQLSTAVGEQELLIISGNETVLSTAAPTVLPSTKSRYITSLLIIPAVDAIPPIVTITQSTNTPL